MISVKDAIISVLSVEWPLSAKQLFGRVVKRSGCAVSYQAVHKALCLLVNENIVSRQGKNYQLSGSWIEKTQKFAKDLGARYLSNAPVVKSEGYIETLFFGSFMEFVRFLVGDFYSRFPNKENIGTCLMNHTYCPLGIITQKQLGDLKHLLAKGKYYAVIRGNTYLDSLLADLFEKLGKKCIIGQDFSFRDDVFVSGNYVMFVFFSSDFSKLMDETYSTIKPRKKLRLDKVFENISSAKTKITVLIIENPLLAQSLREETLEIFSKAGK